MKALNMSVFAAALLLLAGIPVGAQTSGAKAAAEADKYLKRLVKVPGPFGGSAKVEWVKEEYRGEGIDLYSLFTVESEKINTTPATLLQDFPSSSDEVLPAFVSGADIIMSAPVFFMRRLCASGKTGFRRILVYCGLPRNRNRI